MLTSTQKSRSRDVEHARWELAQARGETSGLSSRLQSLLEENERLATELAIERAKSGRLETVVERARTSEARAILGVCALRCFYPIILRTVP